MKISFLIPAYNEEKSLPTTLQNLIRITNSLTLDQAEIIVCDNNSSDRTRAIAESFQAQVVFEGKNQISRARNRAASVATGDLFIFVDADTEPTLELVSEAIHCIKARHWVGGGSEVTVEALTFESRILVGLWKTLSRMTQFAAGSFIFIDRRAFEALHGFSEEIFAGEEIDFSIRAKRLAKKWNRPWGVLTAHPVKTSARKMHLYSTKERIRLMGRLILNGGRMRSKSGCDMWYDGRR